MAQLTGVSVAVAVASVAAAVANTVFWVLRTFSLLNAAIYLISAAAAVLWVRYSDQLQDRTNALVHWFKTGHSWTVALVLAAAAVGCLGLYIARSGHTQSAQAQRSSEPIATAAIRPDSMPPSTPAVQSTQAKASNTFGPQPATNGVWVKPCANLHTGASVESRPLTCIPYGVVLHIQCVRKGTTQYGKGGQSALWDRVSYKSMTGFVSDALLYTGTSRAVAGPC